MNTLRMVMIGSGAVATHLSLALYQAGYKFLQVYSRDISHARLLADRLQAESIDQFSQVTPRADLYIIAVSDSAIGDVVAALPPQLSCVVHTSGSTDIKVLSGRFLHWGVLYPLQTFSKQRAVDFMDIPVLVEGESPATLDKLKQTLSNVSRHVQAVDSHQRGILHIAAVFACNFSNHLYALAQSLLEEQGLSFELIRPLIQETAEKARQHAPASVQTGPAVRGDQITLQRHMQLLADHPDLRQLYQLISQSIQHNSGKNVDDSL